MIMFLTQKELLETKKEYYFEGNIGN